MRSALGILTLAGLLMFQAAAASALESPWATTGKADVRLLAAGGSPGDPALLRAGVEIRLAPGWYTYWRYAGDAGVPPRFDWSNSSNLASVEVRWPAPERIPVEAGLQSIGYRHDVIFPLVLRAKDPAKPVALRLKLDFGVCQKICIPADATLALDVPVKLSATQPGLAAAEARVPKQASLGEGKDFTVLTAKVGKSGKPRAVIDVAVPAGKPFDLFAEGPTDAWALPLPEKLDAGAGKVRYSVTFDDAPAGSGPIPSRLRLTLTSGERAIEVLAPLD
ncbi:MAG: hypothetical protein IT539_08420 [Bradyrhizobiaceae bacterium]|nr:hypothetical protein [Bradyrhizobiaceae bacterium]